MNNLVHHYPWESTALKTVALVCVLVVLYAVTNTPALNTALAMTQLENSTSLLILRDTWNHFRNNLSWVYAGTILIYCVGIGVDIHEFIHNIKQQEENEE